MINNPFTFFISPSTEVAFTYDPGDNPKLWHIHLSTDSYVLLNLVLFAQNKEHVIDIIKQASESQQKCSKQYLENTKNSENIRTEGFRKKRWQKIMTNLSKAKIELAPTDAVMKVTWASNDTI